MDLKYCRNTTLGKKNKKAIMFQSSNSKMKSPTMHPKMWCMFKPAQSGKTRTTQEEIRNNEETAQHLNILITSNNRLLVSQLTRRMTDDGFGSSEGDSETSDDDRTEADDHIDEVDKVFSWMSGSGKTNISVGKLANEIKEDRVTMVVCCAHKARFGYICELLKDLDSSKVFKKRVSIWIDEADVSVKMWAKKFDFTKFERVDRVVLISATFESVFKYYDSIRIRGYETVYNEPTYLRYSECDVIQRQYLKGENTVGYIARILEENSQICRPGVKLFAPGEVEISTHESIMTLLKSRGFAVMILNGQRKEIVLPDDSKIALNFNPNRPEEMSKVLADVYKNNNLERFPFAITGQICLGRGITFQSSEFMFDYGVIPELKDYAAIYQCVARLLGNTKLFQGFKKPTVFCNRMTDVVCSQLAKVAENIARIVFENGLSNISEKDIEKLLGEMDSIKELTSEQKERAALRKIHEENVRLEEFATMKDLLVRYKEIKSIHSSCKLPNRSPAEPHKDEEGFYKSSIGGLTEIQSVEAIRSFATGMKSWGAGSSKSKRGDLIYRVYAGYDDSTPILFLRWTYSLP